MEIKIKKGRTPIGTFQLVRLQIAAAYEWHKYKVIAATGIAKNEPNQDGAVIWMELAEKSNGRAQEYFSLPLSCFDQRVMPNTEADKFLEQVKSVQK